MDVPRRYAGRTRTVGVLHRAGSQTYIEAIRRSRRDGHAHRQVARRRTRSQVHRAGGYLAPRCSGLRRIVTRRVINDHRSPRKD